MEYENHVEDKDLCVGLFNSRRGLGKISNEWIPWEVCRKNEMNRMVIRYNEFVGSDHIPYNPWWSWETTKEQNYLFKEA